MKRVESNEGIILPNSMLHYKYIMITLVILMVSTLLVAVYALATNYKYMNEMAELRAQNQYNSDMATQMLRETRAAAYENTKCKPLSQEELPVANLFGKHPKIVDFRKLYHHPFGGEDGVYKWLTTHHVYGIMTGGMTFNGTTGRIRVPRNGTYYIHSTVQFVRNIKMEDDVGDLAVDIKIVSRCGSKYSSNKYVDTGFNPKHHVIIPKGKKGTSYSTHTSGIARLCTNDTIYLHIQNMPDKIIIRSDGTGYTNFGAFMIAPSCQEENDIPTTSPPTTTSSESQSSPTPNRCGRRDCK